MSASRCFELLDVLCPMHVVFDGSGRIEHAGPTIEKIVQGGLTGCMFLDVFEINRPGKISTYETLRDFTGVKLSLGLRTPPHCQLKGVVMHGPSSEQMTANLSFGISIADSVRAFELTAADFAPTDLTVEMLYLMEAKSAAMDASHQLNQRLQVARVAAERQALTDTLTGLWNRRAMDQELSRAISQNGVFALMQVDLDHFKAVNDTLGHAAGDHVLQYVAGVMLDETRKSDIVIRMGGDEFVILIKGAGDKVTLDRIADRIIARLQLPISFQTETCRISASIGTAIFDPDSETSADQLLNDADAALYAAKNAGRGRHVIFAPQLRARPGSAQKQA